MKKIGIALGGGKAFGVPVIVGIGVLALASFGLSKLQRL